MATLSVIIPTIGRDSLSAAETSCAAADEVIVVEDRTGDNGYTARTKGIAQATGTHIAFLDDDDVFAAGAVDLMREAACDVPVIFRMDHPAHGLLWRERVLEFGNVGTPMMVVPNVPEKLGRWEPFAQGLQEPGGDYAFLAGCVERMGGPVWREEIVATIRPDLPSLAIVTPWLDHPDLVDGYLDAMSYLSPRDELIVVDNGSTPPLTLPGFAFAENRGFAHASNAGLEATDADAVLFLNNDVLMTRWDWLNQIRLALKPGVLVGAQLRYDRHADVDGHSFPYLDGWCLAGMRDDLLELGGFDESLEEPAYYSDNLLCLKARLAGMSLRQADVGLVHLANRTAGHGMDPLVREATLANRERYVNYAREAMGVAV